MVVLREGLRTTRGISEEIEEGRRINQWGSWGEWGRRVKRATMSKGCRGRQGERDEGRGGERESWRWWGGGRGMGGERRGVEQSGGEGRERSVAELEEREWEGNCGE